MFYLLPFASISGFATKLKTPDTDKRGGVQSLLLAIAALIILSGQAPDVLGQQPASSGTIAKTGARPNIVLVFIDDMGWGDFSCFGNKDVQTENIDRMAREGIRFSQFYVNSPICSPSRTAITTGTWPQRWKIGSYLDNRKRNAERGMANWLDPAAPTLAKQLKATGDYRTGHFGKWHMGGQRDVSEAPLISEYGFDQSLTNFEGLGDRIISLRNFHDGRKPEPWGLGSEKLGRGKITYLDRDQVTKAFVDRAISFIDQTQQEGKSFYINVWPDDVHSPFFPPAGTRGDGSKRTLYRSVLDAMDQQLGGLFDRIRNDPALVNNTLILICSDNGPEPGAGSAGGLRPYEGGKATLYEGGIRSPLIVWGPGLIDSKIAGSFNQSSVFSGIDLVPSLLEIADASPDEAFALDGEQLSAVVLGQSSRGRSAPLFFRRPPDRDQFGGIKNLPDLAIRSGDWKLLCEFDGSNCELYDLRNDPEERNNLADVSPSVVERLRQSVTQWHQSIPADAGSSDVR